MQDKHKFKQLGLIYESMVTRGEGGPPDPGSPNFTDRTMSVKVKVRGQGLLTLRFDKNALRPFLDKQNDSINDFLVALGVPDNGVNGPYPFELLQPSDIEYLVRMLNKEFGTTFSYDDVDMLLIDAGPNEEYDDEDAEDSAASGRKPGYKFGRSAADAKKGKRTPPVMPGPKPGEREPLDWRADGGGAEPRMYG